ncbi:MAG: hypothetical protein GXO11_05420 [Epsilonproteobacteria bacterium]|nr:hypothetical protein [Campylobacterota bacterium]
MARGGKSLFSLTTIFASFFGAALIAGAFAYYNYKFSQFKFINFQEFHFYTSNNIFEPKQDKYIVVFFSSKEPNAVKKIASLDLKTKILAIDYYNNNIKSTKNVIFLRSGTNTTLKFIQRFNIYDEPVLFFIKQVNKNLYKQDSMVRKFDTLDKMTKYKNIEEEL